MYYHNPIFHVKSFTTFKIDSNPGWVVHSRLGVVVHKQAVVHKEAGHIRLGVVVHIRVVVRNLADFHMLEVVVRNRADFHMLVAEVVAEVFPDRNLSRGKD